jgi:potassium efflux system protein
VQTVSFSRFLRFLLEEDVYHHLHLERGTPQAISTIAHYAVLLLGFFVAVAALGVDLTKVTILAGAFTVGVGFGLQTVINNFVCGLILLFERPIKVGDVVQVDAILERFDASVSGHALFAQRTVPKSLCQTGRSSPVR